MKKNTLEKLVKPINRDQKFKDIAESFGVTAQEEMDNMANALGGWNTLDIDNLPERFFTRDDIEIESYNFPRDEWGKRNMRTREQIPLDMKVGDKYRCRLKPLESIRITKEIHMILEMEYNDPFKTKYRNLEDVFGRKIEIIK